MRRWAKRGVRVQVVVRVRVWVAVGVVIQRG